jgi:histone H2A
LPDVLVAWDAKMPGEKKLAFDMWLATRREEEEDSWYPGMLESAHFEAAVNLVFHSQLAKHAIAEGTRALEAYESSIEWKQQPASKRRKVECSTASSSSSSSSGSSNNSSSDSIGGNSSSTSGSSISSSCGVRNSITPTISATPTTNTTTITPTTNAVNVIFATAKTVSSVGAILTRRTGQVVGCRAAIFAAEILMYTSDEITELAGNAAKQLGDFIVSPRHIMLAIRKDAELDALIPGLILGGGVIPHIHKKLRKSMGDILSSSEEEKQNAHQEFVIFDDDGGEERSMAPELHHKDFHGEGALPADLELARAARAVDSEEQAVNGITNRILRLIAVRS